LDGATGDVLFEVCNTSATTENAVVADVDGDGFADLVAASNAYASGSQAVRCDDGVSGGHSGIRILGNSLGSW